MVAPQGFSHDRFKTSRRSADPENQTGGARQTRPHLPAESKKRRSPSQGGHTEAAIDLAKLAGFRPAGVLVEIMNEDGTMARLPDLRKVADKFNLKLITIKDLIAFRMRTESQIIRQTEVKHANRVW